MSDTIAISDARANLPELVENVHKNMDRVLITVNGKLRAAVLSIDELESLEETAEVLAIPHIKEDIKKSKKQIKQGEFISLSELP